MAKVFISMLFYMCTFDAEEEHKILSDKKIVTSFNMENSIFSSRFYGFEYTHREIFCSKFEVFQKISEY